MPVFLYRHTLAEARRWNEMDLYKESLQANNQWLIPLD